MAIEDENLLLFTIGITIDIRQARLDINTIHYDELVSIRSEQTPAPRRVIGGTCE